MYFLLNLFSAIALLAFGVYMTKKTVMSSCGASIGNVLQSVVDSRFKAVLIGLGTTMLVQSSTATSLLVSSFLKKNLLSLGIALAIMLGADLGTAIMARVLTCDLSIVSPILLTLGIFLYLGFADRVKLHLSGGIMLGLGLILLALRLIVQTTQPVTHAELTAVLLKSLTNEITFALILGMILAVICFSSLAAVLLTSLLCTTGAIEISGALAVVIGANIGSCILEIIGALKQGISAKRVMYGNTLFKIIIGIVALCLLVPIENAEKEMAFPLSEFVIWFHVVFNAVICIFMLPCVGLMSKLLYALIPERKVEYDPNIPEHLDLAAYIDPNLALGNAVREVLSLGDFLQQMFTNLENSISYKPQEGVSSNDMKNRIRDIAGKISEYLAGVNFDSKKQRRRMNRCLIASADVSECAHIINGMIKRLNKANGTYQASFLPEIRNELGRISSECAGAVNLAVNAFFRNGKEEKQNYMVKKNQCLKLINGFHASYIGKPHLNAEQDMRFFMILLEILEQYRHICVIFDPLFLKGELKTAEQEMNLTED
ncbi:Na/Pi symporter [uncultured Succinivibrio sp.]|uniref:Na/Pi cotransporter family protein n=1 Tax=uncultured Succinivibrio sp. TaxID=540749 RepID=UPI0026015DE3|nr:Na/Pi symporter [uncultured Succinivibrio sp.]